MYYLIGLSGILIIICIILIVKLNLKQKLDFKQLEDYTKLENELKDKIDNLNYQKQDLEKNIAVQVSLIQEKNNLITDLNKKTEIARKQYNSAIQDKTEKLDSYMSQLKETRQKELDELYNKTIKEKNLEVELSYKSSIDYYEKLENQMHERADCASRAADELINEAYDRTTKAIEGQKEEEAKFNAILAPLKQYEMEIRKLNPELANIRTDDSRSLVYGAMFGFAPSEIAYFSDGKNRKLNLERETLDMFRNRFGIMVGYILAPKTAEMVITALEQNARNKSKER